MSDEQPGLTPKGEKMPDTVPEWQHLADLYSDVIGTLTTENSKLRAKVNQLEQKLSRGKKQ